MKNSPFVLLALAGVAAVSLPAQTPKAATVDAPVVLSPFVLSENQDTGYAPNETLSGTRLRTQTKDVASAMTIVTGELMRDLGALNYNDLLDFMPSTSTYTNSADDANSNGPRSGTPFTVRGYRSGSISTNFFTSFTKPDAYNLSRLTFTRGPNSILFSIGNPGGAIDVVTNKADLRRTFHSVDLRGDSFDGFRSALDSNVVLKPGKLALRLDVLHDDRGNNSKPAKDLRRSIFGTVTAQLAKDTVLNANLETTRLRQRIPRPYESFDWVNTWIDAGRPIIAVAQRTTAVSGVEFLATNGYPLFVPGIGAADWARMSRGSRPFVRGARTNVFSFGTGSPNRPVPLTRYIAGDADRVDFDDENYSLVLQHKFARGLYLELGAAHDHNYRENFDGNGMGFAAEIDTNAQLPNGQPNPNVGRPYTDQAPKVDKTSNDDNQLRATLSYQGDLTHVKLFGRGLGRFTVAALYNNEASHGTLETYTEVNLTPLPGSIADLSDARNNVRRRGYLVPGPGYFVSDWAPINEGGVKSSFEPTRQPRNGGTRVASLALAGQANLLDNLIALTAGLRRDESSITQTAYVKDARGLYAMGRRGGTQLPREEGVGRPYLYGIVLNAHPNVSLFLNRAINYQPISQGARTFAEEILPAVRGRGMDAGVKLSLFQDRLTGSLGYFETSQQNIKDTAVTRGRKATWINQIWDAIDGTKRVDTSAGDVKDQRTQGVEFQIVANVTKNFRLWANASRNVSVLEDQGTFTFRYLARQYPAWTAQAARAVVSPDGRTVGELIALIKQEEGDDRRIIGIRQVRTHEWQASAVGRYQFERDSVLKGFAAGGAFRWRNAPVIGFARTGTLLDATRPFRSTPSTNLDTFLEYARPFEAMGRKVRWTAQLRVQNLLDDRTLLPWIAEDDGTGRPVIVQRLRPGARQWVLSSTLAF
ncbi:MAG: TonB-dependent receptor plug domain-containing protein [Opitutaceae bacterium]